MSLTNNILIYRYASQTKIACAQQYQNYLFNKPLTVPFQSWDINILWLWFEANVMGMDGDGDTKYELLPLPFLLFLQHIYTALQDSGHYSEDSLYYRHFLSSSWAWLLVTLHLVKNLWKWKDCLIWKPHKIFRSRSGWSGYVRAGDGRKLVNEYRECGDQQSELFCSAADSLVFWVAV